MSCLSEYKRRWRKKRLLALLSNNHANKNTIVCQVEPSACRMRKQRRFAIVNFKRNYLDSAFWEKPTTVRRLPPLCPTIVSHSILLEAYVIDEIPDTRRFESKKYTSAHFVAWRIVLTGGEEVEDGEDDDSYEDAY
eukprot:scaffold47957_cov60-Attheya_sp.AAC.1